MRGVVFRQLCSPSGEQGGGVSRAGETEHHHAAALQNQVSSGFIVMKLEYNEGTVEPLYCGHLGDIAQRCPYFRVSFKSGSTVVTSSAHFFMALFFLVSVLSSSYRYSIPDHAHLILFFFLRANRRLFEVYQLGSVIQEVLRNHADPDNPFLTLNLRSILINLTSK